VEVAGGHRKMRSKLYDDNIKENGIDRTGNRHGEEIRNAYIIVVRERERGD
jgi:hypothetical protein